MSVARVSIFAALVVASFAAFFVAQRLKNSPAVISKLTIHTGGRGNVLSPNGDGRRDRMRVGLNLKDADRVTITILDDQGDPVRTLVDDRPVAAYRRLWGVPWDGVDDGGREVPDGRYRIRITLRDQGRSFVDPRSVLKDTTPPRPLVASIGPDRQFGPEILPHTDGGAARVRFASPALDCPQVRIFRTAPGPRKEVLRTTLTRGTLRWSWDGLLPLTPPKGGQTVCARPAPGAPVKTAPAPAGTYVVVPQWRDLAGNDGTPMKLDGAGLPVFTAARWPGRGGVTVRRIGVRVPIAPVTSGQPVAFGVDTRGRRYRWSMRLLGDSVVSKRSRRAKTKPRVTATAPGRRSGVYLFTAATRRRSFTVPFAVQGVRALAGTAERPRGVLVVLPSISWIGSDELDDDGDGAPNVLEHGNSARLFRVSARGVPHGFAEKVAPVLIWLDRSGRRYDLTTDAALATGAGPRLTGHRGVLIAGDSRWLSAGVRSRLRAFARNGGTVVSLGTESLRRTVGLDRSGRLVRPSPDRVTDVFGARLRPIERRRTVLGLSKDDPGTMLFEGSAGAFQPVERIEETAGLGPGKLLSSAVTPPPRSRVVIVAARYGKGTVIRPGLPDFAQILAKGEDPAIVALMERMWALLGR